MSIRYEPFSSECCKEHFQILLPCSLLVKDKDVSMFNQVSYYNACGVRSARAQYNVKRTGPIDPIRREELIVYGDLSRNCNELQRNLRCSRTPYNLGQNMTSPLSIEMADREAYLGISCQNNGGRWLQFIRNNIHNPMAVWGNTGDNFRAFTLLIRSSVWKPASKKFPGFLSHQVFFIFKTSG